MSLRRGKGRRGRVVAVVTVGRDIVGVTAGRGGIVMIVVTAATATGGGSGGTVTDRWW